MILYSLYAYINNHSSRFLAISLLKQLNFKRTKLCLKNYNYNAVINLQNIPV